MEDKQQNTKIGAGHAAAMGRLGLHEMRNAVMPESNVAQQHAEYGLYGTATPGEVSEARRADEQERGHEPDRGDDYDRGEEPRSVLADRMQQAEARDDRGAKDRSMERE